MTSGVKYIISLSLYINYSTTNKLGMQCIISIAIINIYIIY